MSSVVITQTKAGEVPVVTSSSSTATTPILSTPPPSSASSSDDSQVQLVVTPACYQRIRQLLDQRHKSPDTMYLRVFVDAGGCSGFQYQFELVEDSNEPVDPQNDLVMISNPMDGERVRVVVDLTSLQYMKGATVDYVQQMIKSAFSVTNNPQSESACGCGSSFAVKNFESNPAVD